MSERKSQNCEWRRGGTSRVYKMGIVNRREEYGVVVIVMVHSKPTFSNFYFCLGLLAGGTFASVLVCWCVCLYFSYSPVTFLFPK